MMTASGTVDLEGVSFCRLRRYRARPPHAARFKVVARSALVAEATSIRRVFRGGSVLLNVVFPEWSQVPFLAQPCRGGAFVGGGKER